MNEEDEATAKAFAALQQTLHGFSSPNDNDGGYFGRQSQQDKYQYNMSAMEWMQNELKETEQDVSMLPLKTPKRTPMMERAGTPIMSNSSSSRNLSGLSQSQSQSKSQSNPKTPGSTYSLDDDSDSDEDMGYDQPMPVNTPIQRKSKKGSVPVPVPTPEYTSKSQSITRIDGQTYNSTALKQSVFRRYHDALWEYVIAKRSLHKRMDLERQEKELEEAVNNRQMTMMMDIGDTISENLSKQECQVEVDFCAILGEIGHGLASMLDDSGSTHNEASMEEGHFWDLLAKLRKLGLPALIWDDDQTSMTQNMSSQSFFLQQLASQTNVTPKELVQAMSSDGSLQSLPLVLERKQQLLKWIQTCLELESRDIKSKLPTANNKVFSPSHPDDPNLPSLISEMDSNLLKNITKVCLALFLEGKNSDALQVARSRGQFSKAAMWKGGEPYGYSTEIRDDTQTVEEMTVGNPNRFLWKRQVWRAGRKLLIDHTSQQQHHHHHHHQYTHSSLSSSALEEAAIYSILSDDVQNALDNPCIRSSWTRSLCVLLMGIQGRTQDEVLTKHNKHKRRSGACFAGYQYEEQENEQLRHTNQLGNMTEAKMAAKLSESLFLNKKDQQNQDSRDGKIYKTDYKAAIMAFVAGKSAILDYCATETSKMYAEIEKARARSEAGEDNDDEYINQDWEGVRFLTHLTLFLDSFKDSSTPTVLDEMEDNKNAIVYQYVTYLESRRDLWHMIALYVCFLPPNTQQTYFPTVLRRVLDNKERQNMTEQIRNLMPDMELPLLREVVRSSLSDPYSYTGGDDVDAIKCNSLQWLLHKDEHLEEALICANILLREFFLNEEEDKTGVAMTFLKEYLPENFLKQVTIHIDNREEADDDDKSSSDDRMTKVNNALAEHLAYIEYLQAYQTFQTWRDTLKATPTLSLENHRLASYKNLNETERSIADSSVMRSWIKEKKQHFETILETAEDARGAWHTVLTYPGGWLSVDEDDDDESDEGKVAAMAQVDSEEMERKTNIRKIRSRHLVLATNLYHQVCEETAVWLSKSLHEAEDLKLSREEILHKLRAGTGDTHNDYTPEFWYQHSLDLASLVAHDKHGIYKAFPPADLKELISKLGETAVSKLMNV